MPTKSDIFYMGEGASGTHFGQNGGIYLSCIVQTVNAILTLVISMRMLTTFRVNWRCQNVDYSTVAKTRGGRERHLGQIWSNLGTRD